MYVSCFVTVVNDKDRWLGSTFSKSFYLQFLYDASATCVVAEDMDGNIIGCGTAKVTKRDVSTPMERDGHVLTLAVDPSWRRRGVGTDLLEVWLADEIGLTCRRWYCRYVLSVFEYQSNGVST